MPDARQDNGSAVEGLRFIPGAFEKPWGSQIVLQRLGRGVQRLFSGSLHAWGICATADVNGSFGFVRGCTGKVGVQLLSEEGVWRSYEDAC